MADFVKNCDKLCGCGDSGYIKQPVIYGIQYSIVTDITVEPVTVEEFKQHARIDFNTDDNLCAQYITAAREHLEQFTQKSFGPKTIEISYLELPKYHKLMHGPVVSTSNPDVQIHSDNVLSAPSGPGSFQYQAGYDPLPEVIRVAIMRYAAGLYMLRENKYVNDKGQVQEPTQMLDEAEQMCTKFRNISWF